MAIQTVRTARPYILYREVTVTVAQITAATQAFQTLTVTGVTSADFPMVLPLNTTPMVSGLVMGEAYVASTNTILLNIANPTASNITQGSTTFRVLVR